MESYRGRATNSFGAKWVLSYPTCVVTSLTLSCVSIVHVRLHNAVYGVFAFCLRFAAIWVNSCNLGCVLAIFSIDFGCCKSTKSKPERRNHETQSETHRNRQFHQSARRKSRCMAIFDYSPIAFLSRNDVIRPISLGIPTRLSPPQPERLSDVNRTTRAN